MSRWPTLSFTIYFTEDHIRKVTIISQWLIKSIKIEVQQCVKSKINRAVFFWLQEHFFSGCVQRFGLWPLRFHPEMGLEQSMVNKFEKCSVLFVFHKQTLYQFRMYTKLVVWHLIMGYKLPWALQYLDQKKNGYWLSICASSCAKLS